ncbi:MAG: hypothetical protein HY875_09385 [Chloroflexi bacterium]|nr:hypothetical protein [Chloroflexota bacterium]
MTLRAALLLLALAPFLAFGAGGQPARANGVPQLVKLTYLDGVSNFGPKDAEGVLEFSFAEAYARVDVKNLQPQAGMVYEGWLVAPDGKTFLVGQIAIAASGIGGLDTKLNGLTRFDYNLFVVTARASTTAASAAMPAQKSIAGRFTVVPNTSDGNRTDIRPNQLPDTGEQAGRSLASRLALTAAATAGAAAIAIVTFRVTRGRTATGGKGR